MRQSAPAIRVMKQIGIAGRQQSAGQQSWTNAQLLELHNRRNIKRSTVKSTRSNFAQMLFCVMGQGMTPSSARHVVNSYPSSQLCAQAATFQPQRKVPLFRVLCHPYPPPSCVAQVGCLCVGLAHGCSISLSRSRYLVTLPAHPYFLPSSMAQVGRLVWSAQFIMRISF